MGLIASLDRTPDASAVWDTTETLGAAATSNSSVYDLGPKIAQNVDETDADYATRVQTYMQGRQNGELLQLRLVVTTCDTATATSLALVSVQGANKADFSGTVWNLGTIVLGHTTQIASSIGVTSTASRGTGEYVLPFYSQGIDSGSATYLPGQQVRYVRLQSKTVGASSSLVFSARIEKL